MKTLLRELLLVCLHALLDDDMRYITVQSEDPEDVRRAIRQLGDLLPEAERDYALYGYGLEERPRRQGIVTRYV